jgi:hypothetical protein
LTLNLFSWMPIRWEMLDRRDLADMSGSVESLLAELDIVTGQLAVAQARNARWRTVIEQHLARGCPSQSLRSLLREVDPLSDEEI